MSDTQTPGGWPDAARPGVPMEPERDGWYWVDRRGRNQRPWLWGSGAQAWLIGDSGGRNHFPDGLTYHGPCLTPAEVAARVEAAWLAGKKDTLAAVATPDAADWSSNEAVRVLSDACLRAEALTPPADIAGALAAREAAARREGIEAAIEIVERTISPWSIAASDECAAELRALLENGR